MRFVVTSHTLQQLIHLQHGLVAGIGAPARDLRQHRVVLLALSSGRRLCRRAALLRRQGCLGHAIDRAARTTSPRNRQ